MKPQPRILTVWRIELAVAIAIPAFVISLLFSPFSSGWWWGTALWLLVFFAFYLVYLPLRYRKLSFRVGEDHVHWTGGVLFTREKRLPFGNIQFTAVAARPVSTLFGLRSLVITVAGGRLVIPGLRPEDARLLAGTLLQQREDA